MFRRVDRWGGPENVEEIRDCHFCGILNGGSQQRQLARQLPLPLKDIFRSAEGSCKSSPVEIATKGALKEREPMRKLDLAKVMETR